MKGHKYLRALSILLVIVLYFTFKPSPLYSDTLGFESAKMLKELAIFNYPNNMSDKKLSAFLKEETNKDILIRSIKNITGTNIDLEGQALGQDTSIRFFKSGNINSYYNLLESIRDLQGKDLSASDSYRLLLEVLGYGPLKDFSHEEVISLAEDIGFGYMHDIEGMSNITNGSLVNIILESLYLKEKDAGIPLIHILADVNPSLKDKAISLNMIDVFPKEIPPYFSTPYKIGTFKQFIGTDSQTNRKVSEYSSEYLNARKENRDEYVESLIDYGFILETDLTKENEDNQEHVSLFYITKGSIEHYVTIVFNENKKSLEIWYAY